MTDIVFLQQNAPDVAAQLIGWRFFADSSGGVTGGTIIETEAYTQDDTASHSYRGQTPRNAVMFGEAGAIYVYFTYGMHWCMNIVTGPAGSGQAVLVRAIWPEQGLPLMRQRRGGVPDARLTDGPAKLCQALGITGADNGQIVGVGRFTLRPPQGQLPAVVATPRIGIRRDKHRLWRFATG